MAAHCHVLEADVQETPAGAFPVEERDSPPSGPGEILAEGEAVGKSSSRTEPGGGRYSTDRNSLGDVAPSGVDAVRKPESSRAPPSDASSSAPRTGVGILRNHGQKPHRTKQSYGPKQHQNRHPRHHRAGTADPNLGWMATSLAAIPQYPPAPYLPVGVPLPNAFHTPPDVAAYAGGGGYGGVDALASYSHPLLVQSHQPCPQSAYVVDEYGQLVVPGTPAAAVQGPGAPAAAYAPPHHSQSARYPSCSRTSAVGSASRPPSVRTTAQGYTPTAADYYTAATTAAAYPYRTQTAFQEYGNYYYGQSEPFAYYPGQYPSAAHAGVAVPRIASGPSSVPYATPYYYPSATATGTPPNPNSPARRSQGLYASGPHHAVGNGSGSARSGAGGVRRNGYQKAAKAGSAAYRRPNSDDRSRPSRSAIEDQAGEAAATEAHKEVAAENPVNLAQDSAAGQNDAKYSLEQAGTESPPAKPEVEGGGDENEEDAPDTHSFSSPPACRGQTPIIRPMLGQSPGLSARRPPRKSPSDRISYGSQYALGTNVYIRGLPVDTTDAAFAEIARIYGSIVSSKAIIEHSTGECRGYGFVMYRDVQQARAAIAGLTARGFQATPAKCIPERLHMYGYVSYMRPPQLRRAEDCEAMAGSLSFMDPPVLHILPSPALAPACPSGADEAVHGFETAWEPEFGEFIPSLDTIAGHYHPDRDGVDVGRGYGVADAETERVSAERRSYGGAGTAAAPSAEAVHLPSSSPSSSDGLKANNHSEQHATSGATHGYVPAPPPQRVQEHRQLQGNQNRQQACTPRYNHPAATPPVYHPPVEHTPPTAAAPYHSIVPPISPSPQRSQQDNLPLRPPAYKSPKLSVGYRFTDSSVSSSGYGGSRYNGNLDESSTNVYIANLALDMTEKDVERLVSPYPTSSCRVLYDGDGRSRGVGFARLLDRESALTVIAELNGRRIPGAQAPLQVRFADSLSQKKLKVAGKIGGNSIIGGKRATGSSEVERAGPPRNRERQLRHGERSCPRDSPADTAVRDAPAATAVVPPSPSTSASLAVSDARSPVANAAGVAEGTTVGEDDRTSASPSSHACPAVSPAEFDAYADHHDEQQKPSNESDDPDRVPRTASADSGCATSANQTPPTQKPQMLFLAADGSVRPYPPRYTSRTMGHGQVPRSEKQDMERQVQQLSIHQAEVSAK